VVEEEEEVVVVVVVATDIGDGARWQRKNPEQMHGQLSGTGVALCLQQQQQLKTRPIL
jgi:hypothetical protein